MQKATPNFTLRWKLAKWEKFKKQIDKLKYAEVLMNEPCDASTNKNINFRYYEGKTEVRRKSND